MNWEIRPLQKKKKGEKSGVTELVSACARKAGSHLLELLIVFQCPFWTMAFRQFFPLLFDWCSVDQLQQVSPGYRGMMGSVSQQHVQQKEENYYVELRRQNETTSKKLYQGPPIPYFINYFIGCISWWTGSFSGEVATFQVNFDICCHF